MFGVGTITTILLFTIMGPTFSLCIIAVAAAYLSSAAVTMFKAKLSDATLAQDIAHIKHAFDTEDVLLETQEVFAAKPNKLIARISRTLIGHHTRLQADPPIHMSVPLQAMRIASIVGSVHAGNVVTKVLEITTNSGDCTSYALANIMPTAEFHIFGTESTTESTSYNNIRINTNADEWPIFDVIFAIESIHGIDRLRDFLLTTSKNLAPHGRLVIIDGFRSENFTAASPDQQLAMRLAERAAGVKELHPMSVWIECAYRAGLRLHRLDDLTAQALPFWTMGWRVSHSIILHTPAWLIRRLRATPYTASATDSLLFFATAAHAMRDRTAAVYGVVEFAKIGESQ